MVSGEPPPTQLSTRHLWSRVNSFKFLCIHITEDLTWSAHTDAVLKKAHQRLFFLRRLKEVWNEAQHPQILLHLHCGEHPDRLHHRLVWKQHRWQPQSSAKDRANCPPHCWRWASLPPGHLHQAVYKESQEVHQGLQPPFPQTALSAAPQEDVSAASDPALANWGIAFSFRLSG